MKEFSLGRRHTWGAVLMCLFVAGCGTAGAYLEPEVAQQTQETVTTAEQLEQALGIPTLTIPRADGKTMWVYEGIYKSAGFTSYIPYLNLVAGYNNKTCTRLSVLVDRETGALSDWKYSADDDQEYWAKTDDKCRPRQASAETKN